MDRTNSLSIKSVKRYKQFVFGSLLILASTFIIFQILTGSWLKIIFGLIYIAMFYFYNFPRTIELLKRLKEISYDKKNLYVQEEDYEIQIPLYQVRDVELVSLDGLYKFKLYHHDQFGREVICKPSAWYPFNFRKVDAELDRIRSMVRREQRNHAEDSAGNNELPSTS